MSVGAQPSAIDAPRILLEPPEGGDGEPCSADPAVVEREARRGVSGGGGRARRSSQRRDNPGPKCLGCSCAHCWRNRFCRWAACRSHAWSVRPAAAMVDFWAPALRGASTPLSGVSGRVAVATCLPLGVRRLAPLCGHAPHLSAGRLAGIMREVASDFSLPWRGARARAVAER